ncbi:MAG: hypothetical protein KIT58_09500 [Planctomycetota bacterium]|nr:hypothetical protein [Planctomycetota bacterium]
MTFVALGLVFGLPAGALPAQGEEAPAHDAERFAAARRALLAEASVLDVTGSAVGRGGEPGRFYPLARELERTGREEGLLALLREEAVVARAAGMVCLARRHPAAAVPALRARRGSQTPVRFNPAGCTVEVITEGDLAGKLLLDADLLEALRERPRPLVTTLGD